MQSLIRKAEAHLIRRRFSTLPEPDFLQHSGEFVTTLWRDWLTERVIRDLQLNEQSAPAPNNAI